MSEYAFVLARLLSGETSSIASTAPPVERLARALRRTADGDATAVDECGALLGDGLSGALLYRSHPEPTLSLLERALDAAHGEARFRLFEASLEIRPVRSEDLVRYVRIGLDAMGLKEGVSANVRDGFSTAQKRVAYRWAKCLLGLGALPAGDVMALFAARGISGTGTVPFEQFQSFLRYEVTALLTPRMSPAVRREVENMGRADWLDMPWMIGSHHATFCLDEIEDDSSPENMNDGGIITHSLVAQRSPSTDFFAHAFAWHPRQTLETIREEAVARGFDIIEPRSYDLLPRRLAAKDLGRHGRVLQSRALRAMADGGVSDLPVDLALVFYEGPHGEEAVFELATSSTFKNDGRKHTVQLVISDPAAIITMLREHAGLLAPATLPVLLARLYGCCAAVRVRCADEGPAFELTESIARLWDAAASGVQPERVTGEQSDIPVGVLGLWRGHATADEYEAHEALAIEIMQGESGLRAVVTTTDGSVIEATGGVGDGRLALRNEPHAGSFIIDCAWDEAANRLEGRWRRWDRGGRLLLEREADARVVPSAEELVQSITGHWANHVRVDVGALRFPGELAQLRTLFEDDHFRAQYVESSRNRNVGVEAMQLDSMTGRGSTELSRAMIPSLFRALDAARTALGLDSEVRLWVHNNASVNAFVTTSGGVISIHFTSGLLDVLDEVELQATIGHELGHVLFGVHDLAMRIENTPMSGATRLRYFALRRYQELSADRMSLIACADPNAALRTQTMLRTGIRRRDLFGGIDALVENARAEVEGLRNRPRVAAALDSHPYDSVRVVAMHLFAQTSQFRALRPDAGVASVTAESDARACDDLAALARLLDVPQPEPRAESASSTAVPRFAALAALALIEADDALSAREVAALRKLESGVLAVVDEILDWTPERRDVQFVEYATQVRRELAVPDRERLLMGLLSVVRADNTVQWAETSVVATLAGILEVDTPSFRKELDELQRGAR